MEEATEKIAGDDVVLRQEIESSTDSNDTPSFTDTVSSIMKIKLEVSHCSTIKINRIRKP